MTKKYEIMSIAELSKGDEKSNTVIEDMKKMVKELGGEVGKEDVWGKRKFAYEINKQTEGFYHVMDFDLETNKIAEFESKLRYMDSLVRYLITAKS